jgi:hypothetical protein
LLRKIRPAAGAATPKAAAKSAPAAKAKAH